MNETNRSNNPNIGVKHGRVNPAKNLALVARRILSEMEEVKSSEGFLELKSKLELIMQKAVSQAIEGDAKAREFIIERAYGKVPQEINLGAEELISECETNGIDWRNDPVLHWIIRTTGSGRPATGTYLGVGEAPRELPLN